MKRLLLSLVCCFPLFFSPSTSFSLDLTEPGSERTVASEQYGPISGDETLWRIASKLRPNRSVTVQQTLLAIYKINPFAFHQGNINKIIPESIIKVPTLQFIQTQTNQEAVVLIAKYTAPKPQTAIPISKPPQAPITETAEPEISPPEDSVAEEKLSALENKLDTLRNELNFVNQQLSLVTAENQDLQLQLQPLFLQLDALKAQLESESVIQERLQNILAVYQEQLAAVKKPPFSGDGLFYAALRFITASITNLLMAIIAPVLLVLVVFLVVMRNNGKASAHKEEQAEAKIRLTSKSADQNTVQKAATDAPLSDSEDTLLAKVCVEASADTLVSEAIAPELSAESENLPAAQAAGQQKKQDALPVEGNFSRSVSPEDIDLSELEVTDIDTIDLTALQLPDLPAQNEDQSEIHHIDENEQFDTALLEQFYQTESEKADHDALQLAVKQSANETVNADSAQPEVSEVEKHNFIAIEKLLQKSESESKEEPYSELVVDLGLDEFPDVINAQYDLEDDENGLSAQLDLARAYLEIGDKAGAKKILLSVVEDSDGAQRAEIEKLLSRLA